MKYLKSLFFLFISLFITTGANGMIADISLDYLVANSDVIAVVDVLATKKVGSLPSGTVVVANLVQVNEPLAGGMAVGERLKIKTRIMEDNAFLKAGEKRVLFLKKVNNYYEVLAGLAGSWPIDQKDKITGYGTGKSLNEVKTAIEKLSKGKAASPEKPTKKREFSI